MTRILMGKLPNGDVNAYFKNLTWKRQISRSNNGNVSFRWRCIYPTKRGYGSTKFRRLLENRYQSSDYTVVQRFPRRDGNAQFTDLWSIPTISQVISGKNQWLIEGMILQGTINLLTAPPGEFKTWLSLSMGEAVSTGADFIGAKTAATDVLYLDRENPPDVIHARSNLLSLNSGRFHIWGHWWEQEPPEIGDPRLIEIARRYRPLMIFDSFVRFHGADENSAKKMAEVMAFLRELADAGATVLLVHHLGKNPNSQYRGSSDILAGVDAAFELRRKKSKHGIVLELKCFKHRQIEQTTVTIRLNLEEGRFELVCDDSSDPSRVDIERIKEVISRHHGITQTDLLRKAELPETNGRRILHQSDGIYWRSKRGEGRTLKYYPKRESD